MSYKNSDPSTTNLPLVIILSIACLILIIFIAVLIVQRRLYKKCPNLMKRICDSPETDNALNVPEMPDLGCEIEPGSQKCPETNQKAKRTNDVQLLKDASDQNDLNSNTSQEFNKRRDSSSDVSLDTMNSEASRRYSDCNYSRETNTSIIQNDWREGSEYFPPLSSLPTSNDNSIPPKTDSLRCEQLEITEENVAFFKCPPERASSIKPDPCPTVAAVLDGALENSVQFVDDLSTLLDPDKQYKSISTWQGLAQELFRLPYSKIDEIRYKTKDHFKEGVLPLLSSHGYTIYDVTSYFYPEPSRRVDVIECIRRYHPNCQKCGEIYKNLKLGMLSKVS
ncbi:uncharacterized protein LOC134270917 [Saccostrea cucullata]|uniref:uncharacterized protein LOC134270917 n=1 Tax=Saccostrea cuccullata TaxID=36930 RepID=UPI002ED608A8